MNDGAIIKIWDQEAGNIIWDNDDKIGIFEYNKDFNRDKLNLSPFKIPLHVSGNIFFKDNRGPTFKGLPGLLADSLPDKFGNTLINEWLKSQGRASTSLNPVERLCFIGTRGMGALEFEPAYRSVDNAPSKINVTSLRQVAEQILRAKKDFKSHLSTHDKKAMLDILKIGTSAGGARPKAIIAYNPRTNEVLSGQTDAPKGFSHWILKFDGVSKNDLGVTSGYGLVEFAYYKMAIDCGINMTECRLFEENGRAHFMTRRFDRDGNKKIHMQSFCALRHFDFKDIEIYSYEELFETLGPFKFTYPTIEQLYRRMVFNVVAQNRDDHTKNFSFLMDEQGQWKFSPAFDICYSYRPGSEWVDHHALSINGKRDNITRNDLLIVGKRQTIYKPNKIIDEIVEVVNQWPSYADKARVHPDLRDEIDATLIRL